MALIKCHECKNQVSTEAKACPACGATVRKPMGALGWIFIATIGAAVYSASNKSETPIQQTPTPAADVAAPTIQDDGKQDVRWKLIQEGIKSGVFQKITTRSELPHLWVTPLWMSLNYELKGKTVDAVYIYYLIDSKGKIDIIPIYDSQTGKHIGRYDSSGLHLD